MSSDQILEALRGLDEKPSEQQKELVAKFYSDIYERLGELDDGIFDEAMGVLGDASEERAANCAEQLLAETQNNNEPDEDEKKRIEVENEWEVEYKQFQLEHQKQREAVDPLDDEFDASYEHNKAPEDESIDQSDLLTKLRQQITSGTTDDDDDDDNNTDHKADEAFEPGTVHQNIAGLQFAFSGGPPKKVIQGQQAKMMQSELKELSKMMDSGPMKIPALKARTEEQKKQQECDFPPATMMATKPVCEGELADCLKHLGVSVGECSSNEAG
eukprot:TRINITY_DN6619_c6_g1_i1.p1 TRINITY_DN6619_c6_g1~~TRINITY_DN6619_c6_g1_i1.p1  ORF type:complete len:272 (+),score=85.10 TRINITY_DN6619_c6_g1_i1:56-871(+)